MLRGIIAQNLSNVDFKCASGFPQAYSIAIQSISTITGAMIATYSVVAVILTSTFIAATFIHICRAIPADQNEFVCILNYSFEVFDATVFDVQGDRKGGGGVHGFLQQPFFFESSAIFRVVFEFYFYLYFAKI